MRVLFPAVCDDNVNMAITFLTADVGQGHLIADVNEDPNVEKIPKDYPAQNPTVTAIINSIVSLLSKGRVPRPAIPPQPHSSLDAERVQLIQTIKKMFVGEHTVSLLPLI